MILRTRLPATELVGRVAALADELRRRARPIARDELLAEAVATLDTPDHELTRVAPPASAPLAVALARLTRRYARPPLATDAGPDPRARLVARDLDQGTLEVEVHFAHLDYATAVGLLPEVPDATTPPSATGPALVWALDLATVLDEALGELCAGPDAPLAPSLLEPAARARRLCRSVLADLADGTLDTPERRAAALALVHRATTEGLDLADRTGLTVADLARPTDPDRLAGVRELMHNILDRAPAP